MFLAKIKGNKVHFWKLVTFILGRGGLFTPYRPPRPPRSVSRGSPARKFSKGGGVNPNFESQGGLTPQIPCSPSMVPPSATYATFPRDAS